MRSRLLFALILSFAVCAPAQRQIQQSPQRKAALDKIQALYYVEMPEWRFHDGDLREGSSPALDDSSWDIVKGGEKRKFGSAWFRRWIEVPKNINGWDPTGATIRLDLSPGWYEQLYVYANGAELAVGEEGDPIILTANAQPGQRFLIAVRKRSVSGESSERRWPVTHMIFEAPLTRPDPSHFRDEVLSAEQVLVGFPEGERKFDAELTAAAATLDFAALERGDQKAFDASITAARQRLNPLREWLKQYSIVAAGNSHIDMAWLWPWTETVDVVKRTFGSALQLMNEFPDVTFTMASARTYAWMEEKYPDMFRDIQKRVKEGRWEPIGGMWVEPDLNMPDGEAMVRQVLIGTRYFKEKFGVQIRTGWNPDSFGYNWQLPQIYKKSGMDFFVTQKISWNDTTKFPHKLFWWEAPDGSRILTYFPRDYANRLTATRVAEDVGRLVPETKDPEILFLFGVGDHGGGPTRIMLENAYKFQRDDDIFPRLRLGPVQPFLDRVAKSPAAANAPVWRDELYFEYHRGVYTTQANTKHNNRRNEVNLLNAEKFAALAHLFGRDYPQQRLGDTWKRLLFNQFHDILPGSGIAPVYVDASRDHEDIRLAATEITNASLAELAAHANTRGVGVPVIVFNALPWARTEMVETEVQLGANAQNASVLGPDGKPATSQVLKRNSNRVQIRFLAANVPSLGYAVYRVSAAAAAPTVLSKALENEFLRVSVDSKTGCITSIFDKKNNREALAQGACGNELQAFRDKPKDWDAWNIDAEALDQRLDGFQTVSVEPSGTGVRVTRKFQDSTFIQDISVAAGVPLVSIRTQADWHEKHVLVKAAFPVAVQSNFATYEIPFGSIKRPTTRNTPEEKAKFEVPSIRWADLSDEKYGVSLLNDSKYGYDTKGNVLRLSLLRAPEWPDPHADEGHHEFSYAIFPHAGDWTTAGTMQRGYEFNNHLIVLPATSHGGELPPSYSFVSVSPANVIIAAIKKAEDEDALIVRLYEFAGKPADVKLTLHSPAAATAAVETNLMEVPGAAIAGAGGAFSFPIKPYEIKTVKVSLGKTK